MIRPNVVSLAAGSLLFGGLLIGLAPRPSSAQILSGLDVYRSNCGGCHELYDPEEPRRNRKEWETILTRMVKVRGATLSAQEYTAVLNYLDSFNRPPRQIQWVEAPASTHKVVFSAADAGKLPATWVDLTVGSEEVVPWAVQADAVSKSFYLSPLKAAGESMFPVLIDNSGLVRNGSASARIQLVSGKGPVGAGLVFGFRNPQAYFGVRISPRDVVLYEVNGGQRARLALAAAPLKARQWHTLAVDIHGKEVRVSLNGKPLPSLTRVLPGYQGGRLGIHTQSDTVALFDRWEVAIR